MDLVRGPYTYTHHGATNFLCLVEALHSMEQEGGGGC